MGAYNRVFLIVLDGVGVGGAPDAESFGDSGADTLGNTARAARLACPTLTSLGLGNLYPDGLPGLPRTDRPRAHYGRLTELSAGKDTTTGHWELMGIVRDRPSPTFPQGFPPEFIAELERSIGVGTLANHPASGTQVIADYGAEHLATGRPIVYTSADSVLQIAAHVDVVPLHELYRSCEVARELAVGSVGVDRIIARPFEGSVEAGFTRTPDRKDYSLPPPGPTGLDLLEVAWKRVIGVGKISDIFAGRGITKSYPEHGNRAVMRRIGKLYDRLRGGLVFANLVDFDMLYGHRNDAEGMALALSQFDVWLETFLGALFDDRWALEQRESMAHRPWAKAEGDLVLITADHGNDPTSPSTDHNREQVPLLMVDAHTWHYEGRPLDPPAGFYHVGATVLAALGVDNPLPGAALLP